MQAFISECCEGEEPEVVDADGDAKAVWLKGPSALTMTSAHLHCQGAMPPVLIFDELNARGCSRRHQILDARKLSTQTYQTPGNPTASKPQGGAHLRLSSQR